MSCELSATTFLSHLSSLTPHGTGPNLTAGVRKAYILQYAPNGAHAYRDPAGAGELQNDPHRQFLIGA